MKSKKNSENQKLENKNSFRSKLKWVFYLLSFGFVIIIFLFFISWMNTMKKDYFNSDDNEIQQESNANVIDNIEDNKENYFSNESLEKQLQLLKSIPSRMSLVEDRIGSLVGVSSDTRNNFLISEAEYYLEVANFQLQILNSPKQASLALNIANQRIKQIPDLNLIDVQQTISNEIDMLEKTITIDLEKIVLQIVNLIETTEILSFKKLNDASEEEGADLEEKNALHAWNNTKKAISNLVQITPPGSLKELPKSYESERHLKSILQLQLQLAAMALMQREQAIFDMALNNIDKTLDKFFDSDNEQIINIKMIIADIKSEVSTLSAPDISASLSLLSEFKKMDEATE
tara:strand:+ start:409 stop:1446 length:1038 start_codon:yes stop_codon:yes gene_type:complete